MQGIKGYEPITLKEFYEIDLLSEIQNKTKHPETCVPPTLQQVSEASATAGILAWEAGNLGVFTLLSTSRFTIYCLSFG